MKNTLYLTLATLSLILMQTTLFGQGGGWDQDPEERAKQQTARMTQDLSLSEKQAEKVGEINLKYAQKMKETRAANQDGDWSSMRETMMKLRQEQNEELKGVLTSVQYEQWTKIQQERWKDRGGQEGPRRRKGNEKSSEEGQ